MLGFPVAQTESDAAQTTFNRGVQSRNIGTAEALNQAIADLETARNLWREAGNVAQEVTALNWLGLVYADLGRYSEAIAVYRQILERLPAARDDENRPFTEASTLLSTAKIHSRRGNYQEAMEQLMRSLELWQKVGYSAGEAAVRNELGLLYVRLGDFDRALEEYDRLFSEIADLGTGDRAALLNNRGQVRAERGEWETALEDYRQALNLWQELGKIREQAATLNNIGFAQTDSEKFREALDTYNEALLLWQESGDRGGEASTLSNIGFVYTRLNEPEKALEFCDRALPLRREFGDRDREATTRYCLAIAYRQQGNLTEARSHIETALNIIEDLRTNVKRQELRTTFLASKQEYYEFYIDLLMELHRQSPESGFDGLALRASERAKARSLLDILSEGNGEITAGISPKLLAEKRQLQQQIAAAEARRVKLLSGSHTDEQKQAITDEIEDLLDRLENLRDTIRATSPRYAALTQPQALDLAAIQRDVLDENTALLEYAIGRDRSYLWVVTSEEIRSHELPGREEIEAAVRHFREAILAPSLRFRPSIFQKAGTDLRAAIIPAKLPDKQRLVIVADGALQYVPFVALPTEGTRILDNKKVPLIVRHEVITLPSASTLGVLRQQIKGRTPPPKTLAIFADPVFGCNDDRVKPSPTCEGKYLPPDLERSARESGVLFDRLIHTQTEAEQILSLIPESETAPKFGFSARREVATTPELSNYKMLHFATHGLLNSATPELSGLVLSLVDERGQLLNGFLRLYDIFNLNLPAELVVLSACETGLGRQVRGEGLIGLTRGFMYAGAPRVVVSLWSVDDRATAELMVKFYQKMLDGGQSPAAALRSAQIDLWQSSEWNSPFFWAGFTLQGEWEE
ncbi:MAG: CHAT domain-containing protein [Limnospira sp.]